MASSNFSRVIGPIVGGAFLQTIGMQAVYFLGTSLFIVASALAFSMLIIRKTPTDCDTNSQPAAAILTYVAASNTS